MSGHATHRPGREGDADALVALQLREQFVGARHNQRRLGMHATQVVTLKHGIKLIEVGCRRGLAPNLGQQQVVDRGVGVVGEVAQRPVADPDTEFRVGVEQRGLVVTDAVQQGPVYVEDDHGR